MPRFSKQYQDFDLEYKSVLAYITTNQATLGVTVEQVTAYTASGGVWTTAYTAYSDSSTRTAPDIAEVKVQYLLMRHETNVLQQQIKSNASIVLNEDARIKLYIHLDKTTRTRVERPTTAPSLLVLSSMRLVSKISATYPTTEEENHRGLPIGVIKIVRVVAVTDTAEAPARDAYNEIDSTGHTVSTIQWGINDVSKFGWAIYIYQNNRGENGPESAPLMVSIVN